MILVSFPGNPGPFPPNQYHSRLFGSGQPIPPNQFPPRTLAQFYSDMSKGNLTVTGAVFGWYEAPKPSLHYEGDSRGLRSPTFRELLQFAFEEADKQIDFSEYDSDDNGCWPAEAHFQVRSGGRTG